ncbi:hypothetical protein CONPUDRAFT_147511 [Coniophora puteana RWD-64-598 SS2]|uniref:Uncharacterized protein n=1 Tax=Coniophora puteana (strain RWD-64-598) TaxID=741705 RepID=A0A5M3M6J4_CONPW|nr:uncharacterized protein CONPUDRAFT_147511 [Coniophora puteana RWD-64-598 SS2]EIW74959.1 hypothetical protein CONPUDRAFT_147511 [Coniophora puteana RWD-64-598 SS2]
MYLQHDGHRLLAVKSDGDLTWRVKVVYTPLTSGIACGFVAWLFFACVPLLVKRARAADDLKSRRWLRFYVVYVTCMLVLGMLCSVGFTVSSVTYYCASYTAYISGTPIASSARYTQMANALIDVSAWLSALMSDALLVWRCCMLYNGQLRAGYVKAGLGVFFTSTYTLGMLSMFMYALPEAQHLSQQKWATVVSRWYYTSSAVLNVTATSLMVTRVRSEQSLFRGMMGARLNHTGIVAMMIESCALFTAAATVYLMLCFVDSPFRVMAVAILCETQVSPPYTLLQAQVA